MLQGVVFHLIRNVNYLCIVAAVVCLFVCLSWWRATIEIREVLWRHSSRSPPHYFEPPLSHLAVKWRNSFKASSSFYWSADHFIIRRCCSLHAWVCVICVCMCSVLGGGRETLCACVRFLGHIMLLFLENPLDGDVCCLKSRIYCQNKGKR